MTGKLLYGFVCQENQNIKNDQTLNFIDVEEVAIFSKEVMKSIGSLEEVEGFDFESSEFPIIRIISIPSYAQKPKYSFVFRRKEETEETISKILPSN